VPRTHHSLRGRRTQGERYPSRRLSSIGGRTTGWRSSLETNPHQSLPSFVGQLLIAAAALVLIVAVLVLVSRLS
jgi:hypothetical protein